MPITFILVILSIFILAGLIVWRVFHDHTSRYFFTLLLGGVFFFGFSAYIAVEPAKIARAEEIQQASQYEDRSRIALIPTQDLESKSSSTSTDQSGYTFNSTQRKNPSLGMQVTSPSVVVDEAPAPVQVITPPVVTPPSTPDPEPEETPLTQPSVSTVVAETPDSDTFTVPDAEYRVNLRAMMQTDARTNVDASTVDIFEWQEGTTDNTLTVPNGLHRQSLTSHSTGQFTAIFDQETYDLVLTPGQAMRDWYADPANNSGAGGSITLHVSFADLEGNYSSNVGTVTFDFPTISNPEV